MDGYSGGMREGKAANRVFSFIVRLMNFRGRGR